MMAEKQYGFMITDQQQQTSSGLLDSSPMRLTVTLNLQ